MGKKDKTDQVSVGTLSVPEIVLTYTSHDGKIVKTLTLDPSFISLKDDSENSLAKKAKYLLHSRADKARHSYDKWR